MKKIALALMVLRRDKHLTRGLREMMKCLREFKG